MSSNKSIQRMMFPYGMAKNDDGTWTLFNRDYSPVGVVSTGYHQWNDDRHKVQVKGLGPATLRKLDHRGEGNEERIYFYNDACQPDSSEEAMAAYLKKLAILIRLKS